VVRVVDPVHAVSGADVVLAITASADATGALEQALSDIPGTAIYADFSTSSAGLKRELAGRALEKSLGFVDVALMSTVPGKGIRTPALASGVIADRFVSIMAPHGMSVESVGEQAGLAATRKLLRSVVVKGLAGLLIESMHGAGAAGLAEETWQNLVEEFTRMAEAFLRRMIEGSAVHGPRRLHEMEASAALSSELGVEPLMTHATVERLGRVVSAGLRDIPN
jgi:3-hydroxyisobutyrate dehydrogenase-like beta-hydroxyacid dehydrogenase